MILVDIGTAIAVARGIRLYRPRRQAAWWLLVTAIVANGGCDAVCAYFRVGSHDVQLLAIGCHALVFSLIITGLLMLSTRRGIDVGERGWPLRLAAPISAAFLLLWVCLIGPVLTAGGLSGAARSCLATYAVVDFMLIITTGRLLAVSELNCAGMLLAVGACGQFFGDVTALLWQVDSGSGWISWTAGALWYVLLPASWAAAASHPSMARLSRPRAAGPAIGCDDRGFLLVRGSLAVPPLVMLVLAVRDRTTNMAVAALVVIIMCELVATQLLRSIHSHRGALAREHGLRETSGVLLSAVDATNVFDAGNESASALVPEGAAHQVVILLRRATPDGAIARPAAGVPGQPIVVGAALDALLAPAGSRQSRLVPTRIVQSLIRMDLGRFDTALVCPLVPRSAGRQTYGAGALVLMCRQPALMTMRDAVETLAAQMTMALDRIALENVLAESHPRHSCHTAPATNTRQQHEVAGRGDVERESIRRALRRSRGWQNRERLLNRFR